MPVNHRKRLWTFIFVGFMLVLAVMATEWNLAWVQNYQKLIDLAGKLRSAGLPQTPVVQDVSELPLVRIFLGSLGFITLLGGSILFFVKIQKEMRLNLLQTDFISSVTHELKTPIATLELSSNLLRNPGVLSEEDRILLWESHHSELARLKQQVESLLEASLWQSEGFLSKEPTFEVMEIEPFLATHSQRWKSMLGLSADLAREGSLHSLRARLDPAWLVGILDILFDNARKFARETPNVRIRSGHDSTRYWISVEDEGFGFDPEDEDRLFERFFRSSHGAPYPIPGTGLGLFLARQKAERLGLELTAKSRGQGLGATFILSGRLSGGAHAAHLAP